MNESIKNLWNNRNALIAYIKAVGTRHIKHLAQHMNVSQELLLDKIQEFNLCEYFDKVCSPETELAKCLPTFKKNRKVLKPYEIDLYDDNLKLGIEFNGNYWHSSKLKDMFYHQNKSIWAYNHGIRLYHIFEYEWNKQAKPFIGNHISYLGKSLPKVQGDFKVKEIRRLLCEEFLYYNTLEYQEFERAFGLFTDDLVAVLTIKDNIITNYIEKLGVIVPNGLFYLTRELNDEYLYYQDFAKPVYETSGLFLKNKTDPNTIWYNAQGKLSAEKKRYLLNGHLGDEDSYLRSLGYNKIYDCGNLVFTTKG